MLPWGGIVPSWHITVGEPIQNPLLQTLPTCPLSHSLKGPISL